MADYNLGTAHGRILIDVDDKGSAKAAKSMQNLDQDSAKASQRLEQFAQYCDQVEDRLQAVTNRLEGIDFTPIDNLAAANQRGGFTAEEHRNKMVALTATIGEMGAVAAGAGSQGQNKLRQAGIGLVQTFGDVGRSVEQTSFKMELFNYTMNGLDKTVGRASRVLDAINTPFRDLSGAGIRAYMTIDRITNRFSAFAAAGQLVGAVASGVVAAGLTQASGAAVGLGAALVSMSGVVMTLPAMFLSVALAAATLKVATAGMGDAMKAAASGDVKAMNEAMKDMPPQMKEVVTETAKLAPMFKALKLDVQTKFWMEMGTRVSALGRQYLPMVGTAMGRVAESFNSGMHDVIDFYQEARTIAEVNGILDNSAIATNNLTTRFGSLARVFHTVTAIGSEFLPMLSNGLGIGIDKMTAFVTSAEGITKIRGWIAGGIATFGDFWVIIKNVGATIGSIFKIANANGQGFFDKLVILTTQMRVFAASSDGAKAIGGIFAVLKAASDAVMPAILALVKVIGVQLAPGLAQLITLIGPKLVPFIEAFGDGIARMMSAVPELADMFNKLLDALTPLLPVLGQSIGDQIKFWQNFASIAMPIIQGLINAFTALPVPVQSFLLAFAVLSPVIFKVIFSITKFMTILTLMATLTGKSSLAMRLLGIAPAQAGKRFVFLRRVIATLFSPFSKLIALGARLGKIKWLTAGLSKFASIAGPIGKVASAFTRFSNVGRVLLGLSKAASFLLQAFKIASILKFFGALITWPKRAATAFLAATKRIVVASFQWIVAHTKIALSAIKSGIMTSAAWVAAGIKSAAAWTMLQIRALGAFLMVKLRAAQAALASAASWVMAGIRAAGAWIAMQARALATFLMVQLRAAVTAAQTAAAWVAAGVRSAGAWLAMQARALATFLMVQIRAAISAAMTAASWVAAGARAAASWIMMQIRALATFTIIAARAVASAAVTAATWVMAGIRAAGAWLAMQARALVSFAITAAGAVTSAAVTAATWVMAGIRAAGAWVVMQARAIASFAITAASATAGAAAATAAWVVAQARMAAGWLIMQVRALVSMAITVAGVVAGWVVMGTQAMIQAARMAAAWLIAMGPVGIIIAIVIALVALIIMNWDKVKAWTIAAFTAVWTFLTGIWNSIVTTITTVFNSIVNFLRTWGLTILAVITGPIGALIIFIITHWEQIKAFTLAAWNALKMYVQMAIQAVYNIVMSIIAAIVVWVVTQWTILKTGVLVIWNAIKTGIQTAITAVRTVVMTIINAIVAFFTAAWNNLRNNTMAVWNAIRTAVTTAINAVRTTVTNIINAIKTYWTTSWNMIGQYLTNAWNRMKAAVTAGVQAIVGYVRDLIARVKGFFSGAGEWLRAAGKAILDGLLNGLKSAWNAVAGWVGDIGNKIKALKGPMSYDKVMLRDEGEAIMGGLHKAMKERAEPMFKWVGTVGEKVTNMVNGANIADKLGKLGKDAIAKLAQGLNSSQDKVRDAIARVRETLQGVGDVPLNKIIDKVRDAASKAGVNLTPYLGASAGSSSPETRAGNYVRPVTPAGATTAASATPRPGDTYNLYTTVPQGSTVKELSETITFDLRHAGKGVYR